MKKIFAIIFSLQLMLQPLAIAEDSGGQFRQGDASEGGGAGFYASQIMGLTTGIIGANILASCKLGSTQPSIYIFFGASLANIVGEIAGGKAQNNFHVGKIDNLKMVEEKMKEGGDLQKEILVTALENEKTTRDFIKKRKGFMIAVSTLYTAAVGVAIYEAIVAAAAIAAATVGKPPTPIELGMAGCTPSVNPWLPLINAAFTMVSGFGGSTEGAISTYGGMATSLAMLVPGASAAVSGLYNFPIPRSITFGVSAALAITITAGLAERQNIAEENIGKMERVIAQFKNETKDKDGVAEDAPKPPEDNPTKDKEYEIKKLAQGAVVKDCLSGSLQNPSYGPGGCSNSLKIPKTNFNLGVVSPNIVAVTNLGNTMTQALADGDMAKAELASAGISALAARVKADKDFLEKKLNDQLKASGKPAINFEKKIAEQISSMQSSLGGQGNAPVAALDSSGKASVSSTPKNETSSPITTATNPAVAEIPELGLESATETSKNSDLDSPTQTASLDESLDQYESTVEDISKKSDVSIFKQVSNRYILNYTKIFKEKKRVEEASP